MAIKLLLYSSYPDHPHYLQLLSLFLIQYTRAPKEVKSCKNSSFFIETCTSKLYNDEVHEIYNSEVQDLVRSHKFVKSEDYIKGVAKLPYIMELKRKLGVASGNSKHIKPINTWQDENAIIFAKLFYFYDYIETRDHIIMINENGDSKIFDHKE